MTYPKIDKPTVPGWYFVWHGPSRAWCVAKVFDATDGKLGFLPLNEQDAPNYYFDDYYGDWRDFTSWRGPLPEPTE